MLRLQICLQRQGTVIIRLNPNPAPYAAGSQISHDGGGLRQAHHDYSRLSQAGADNGQGSGEVGLKEFVLCHLSLIKYDR